MLEKKEVRRIDYQNHNSWQPFLEKEFASDYYQQLSEFLRKEYQSQTIYPPGEEIFTAFDWTPYDKVKVVILGQDPYHGYHQAHGLSFSVLPGNQIPPSLRNIYKELEEDLGISPVTHGYLKSWAEQGVLLLNTVLTVRGGEANSHRGQGWEQLTDRVIQQLSLRAEPLIFILWGKPAQSKLPLIDQERHFILQAPHPSPLSAYRGFFGSKPFSQVNQILSEQGLTEINWQLPLTV